MRLKRLVDGREFNVDVESAAGKLRVKIDDREIEYPIALTPDGNILMEIGGRKLPLYGQNRGRTVLGVAATLNREFAAVEGASRGPGRGLTSPEMLAPMPGKILRIFVKQDQTVAAGDPLIVIEAMKMETVLSAESPAIIQKLEVSVGQMVEGGQLLIRFSPAPDSSTH